MPDGGDDIPGYEEAGSEGPARLGCELLLWAQIELFADRDGLKLRVAFTYVLNVPVEKQAHDTVGISAELLVVDLIPILSVIHPVDGPGYDCWNLDDGFGVDLRRVCTSVDGRIGGVLSASCSCSLPLGTPGASVVLAVIWPCG